MATNPYDQFDAPAAAGNPYDAFDEPTKPTSAVRKLADVGVAFGQGVVGGVKSLTDVAGADNAASGALQETGAILAGALSPARKAEKAARDQKIAEAEASGSTLQEVGAHLGGFVEAPVSAIAQGVGSIAPTMAALLLPGGQAAAAARTAAMLGVGAAQGAGAVKGSIYDAVKQQHIDAGAAPVEAERAATEAQSYAGPNAANIAGAAALGAAAGRFGAEGALERVVAGQPARAGVVRRAATGAATEGATEAAQGGQEQYAANVAQQREGFDVPTAQGVAGQAAVQGVTGAVIGGGVAAPSVRQPKIDPSAGPLSRAAAQAVDSGLADEMQKAAATAQAEEEGGGKAKESEQLALPAPTVTVDSAGTAKTAEQRNVAADAGVVETGAMGLGRNSEPAQLVPVEQTPPALTYDTAPTGTLIAGEQGVRPEIRAEEINRQQVASEASAAREAEAQRQLELGTQPPRAARPPVAAPQIEFDNSPTGTLVAGPDGVLRPETRDESVNRAQAVNAEQMARDTENARRVELGLAKLPDPDRVFKNRLQAGVAARQAGLAYTVVPVEGGFAVRRPSLPTDASPVDVAAHEAATSPMNDRPEPTDAQKEAGNYKLGHTKIQGLDISIENPRGSTRSGKRPDGSTWSHTMSDHYGYLRRTVGADGDQVDVYVGPKPESQRVFIIDQIDQQTGKFDEAKVMLGYPGRPAALKAYRSNFDAGWKVGPVRSMSMDEFKTWLKEGDTKAPAAAQRLDHGELNIPGRTNGIDAELDRYKAKQTTERKVAAKAAAAQTREDKERARALFAEHGAAILAKFESRFGRNDLKAELDSMLKWEPAKFITLAERFVKEQAAAAADTQPQEPPAAIARARSKNTFSGQAPGAGRSVGMTQPKGTPVEKLFANFADNVRQNPGGKTVQEQLADFRGAMMKRAAAEPRLFAKDDLLSADMPLADGMVARVESAAKGGTRVQVLDASGQRIAAARIDSSGMLDSIAVDESARGRDVGKQLLAFLDREGLANVDEVPDRSPGFVRIQRAVISGRQPQEQPRADQAPEAQPLSPRSEARAPADVRVAEPAGRSAVSAAAEAQQPGGEKVARPGLERMRRAVESRAASAATTAQTGKEVSRDVGKHGEGMSEFRAKQVRAELAKKNPKVDYRVEEDDALKNGFAVVGRERPAYRRSDTRDPDLVAADKHLVEIQQMADEVVSTWARKPDVIVARDIFDSRLPPAVLEDIKASFARGDTKAGAPQGVFLSGKIYLIAGSIPDLTQARIVLLHEGLGHLGLRGTFGKGIKPILQQVATMRRADVEAKAKAYGLDVSKESDRLMAAEEVLATLAQTRPEMGFVRRTVAAIRNWLRENVPGFKSLALSDADIIQKFILPARGWVERGRPSQPAPSKEPSAPAYKRAEKTSAVPDPEAGAFGELTPEQERALRSVAAFQKPPTIKERFAKFRENLGLKARQGIFDQFAPIRDYDQKAYIQARLSKGSDGTMEAAMLYGKPFLRDGVPDVKVDEGGFAQVLAGLKGEHDRFLWWVAAQRAERLKAEGKENLFSDRDISALKSMNAGTMADGSSRTLAYAQALKELNAFNDAVLKVAEESGLIDKEARELFKGQPYVPFYRVLEEEGQVGPRFSSGLVGQRAWQKLKGGSQQVNADLLENMLLNWSHLYSAAARNRAALASIDAADKLGIAHQTEAGAKGSVKILRDGVAEHWAVEDPYLMQAITALHYTPSPLIKPLAMAKQWLTWGVTINPTFKIRNLIRDSLSAISQADLSYNPLANVAKGWKATSKDSQTYASMLAGGGVIKFGTTENTERVRRDIEKLGGKLADKTTMQQLAGLAKRTYDAYSELGDRTENVNRTALYDRLVAKGMSHAEASFAARDLMDFSMSGRWDAVRFLAQTVPFLNARLQGLYKLGRAARENPRRFGAMAAAVSMASLALWSAYSEDDDWKKREDWDRDAYWWFKIGDTAYRIPKPFELGSIGTMAERTAEWMFDDEMTGKRFRQRVAAMLFQTFSMDPVPQLFKPLLDVYSNKDSFTKREIETEGDERLRPQDRANERTTEVARLLGQMGLPEPLSLLKGEYKELSPKQVDFLLRGYFSWVATAGSTMSDYLARPMMDRGERPAMRLKDTFLVGNFAESLPSGTSRYVSTMYEQAREIEQAYASYRDAVKRGDHEKAAEIKEEEAPKLRARFAVEGAKRQLAEINAQARKIEANRLLSGEAKRERLQALEERRDAVARRVPVIP